MEKWIEIFKDEIPRGNYSVKLINGEEDGLVVELKDESNIISLDFGNVFAVRMLDEGIVQKNIYSENEVKKYKKDNFKNIIYQVENGLFAKKMSDIFCGLERIYDIKHYVIITQNYNIDILTEWEVEKSTEF